MAVIRIVLLALGLLILIGAGYGTYVIRHGFSARDQPTGIETVIAKMMRRLAVPSRAKSIGNGLPATNENIRAGMAHWADHCAQCHANNGSGDTGTGRNLYPKAPDMRQRETQDLTDGELYYTIQNGIRLTGMPAWGSPDDGDNNQDSWKLVLFIRHLPRLTPDEENQMERLNPKSREELEEEQGEQEFLNSETPTTQSQSTSKTNHYGGHHK